MSRIFPIELAGARVIIFSTELPETLGECAPSLLRLSTDASVRNSVGGFAFVLEGSGLCERGLARHEDLDVHRLELFAAAAGLARAAQLLMPHGGKVELRADSGYVLAGLRRISFTVARSAVVNADLWSSIRDTLEHLTLQCARARGYRGQSNRVAHRLARIAVGLPEPISLYRGGLTYSEWVQFLELTPEYRSGIEALSRELGRRLLTSSAKTRKFLNAIQGGLEN